MPSFICDVMLGRLARRLRMYGFRTAYGRFAQDDALIRQAVSEKNVLLTRDVALAKKGADYCKTVLLTRNDVNGQLCELFGKLKIRRPKSFRNSVCTACGGTLRRVPKESVRQEVWPRVFARQKAFSRCESCGKLYWKGTHVKNLEKKTRKARPSKTRKKAKGSNG